MRRALPAPRSAQLRAFGVLVPAHDRESSLQHTSVLPTDKEVGTALPETGLPVRRRTRHGTLTMGTIDSALERRPAPSKYFDAGGVVGAGLIASGILASLLYAGMLVVVPMGWDTYSSSYHTVSELAAIDAPTRRLWVTLGRVWTFLYFLFGLGVWLAAGSNRALRLVGVLIVAASAFGLFWPPMHLREVLAVGGATLTDTLHIAWTFGNGLLTLLAMGFGAAALGRGFRTYSIVTMVILLAAGALTGSFASRVQANLPTHGVGIWERINIASWLLWVVVLAALLLVRERRARNTARIHGSAAV